MKTENFYIEINNEQFPIYLVNNKSKKLLLYIPGLNGNGSLINHISNYFPDFTIVSFDARAQGSNNAKPSRKYKTYINDINEIIENLRIKLNFDELYLMGESWGTALCILYNAKYHNKVKKIVCWNCPYKINNVDNSPVNKKMKRNIKMMLTYFFNIDTYDDSDFNEGLINNKVILRAIKVFKRKTISNKVIIASWKSFRPAWNFIFKHQINNYLYIQSLEDIMLHKSLIKKFNKIDNLIVYEKGHHILMFDIDMKEKLFNDINAYLNK